MRPKHSDRGASLALVLIMITAVALVVGVTLSLTDTGQRATIALRDQASDNYSADGATNAVLDALKQGSLTCGNPSASSPLTLGTTTSPFYAPGSSQQGALNAYAQCSVDAVNGTGTTMSTPPPTVVQSTVTPAPVTTTSSTLSSPDSRFPSYAVMAVGKGSSDYGIKLDGSAGINYCVENGSVASNKDVELVQNRSTLSVRFNPSPDGTTPSATDCTQGTSDTGLNYKLVVTAARNCLDDSGKATYTPTTCTAGASSVTAPAAPDLSGDPATIVDPAPVCNATTSGVVYAAFVPGYYTSPDKLNAPCSGAKKNDKVVEWFSTGTSGSRGAYYFDFPSSNAKWTLPDVLVAGTPTKSDGTAITGLNAATSTGIAGLSNLGSAPKSCVDPATALSGGTTRGDIFVFVGHSYMDATASGKSSSQTAQICSSSAGATPPPALVQLASATTKPSGSASAVPATLSAGDALSLIQTANSGQASVYITGYTYAPNATLDLTLKNTDGQVFSWGVVAANITLNMNATAPIASVFKLPRPNQSVTVTTGTSQPPTYTTPSTSQPAPVPSTTYQIRYIYVWTCTVASLTSSGASHCPTTTGSTSIKPNISVRVLTDPSGRTIQKILSWSRQ